MLAEVIGRIAQASRQIEVLVDGLAQRTNALLRLVEQSGRSAPVEPPVPTANGRGIEANGQPDEPMQLAHEPF